MATFNESLDRIRRFLRDPDGLIWPDEDIRIYWNDSQLEIADKIGFIEKINAYSYPPLWTWAYQWDWEIQHIDGDKLQALNNWPVRNMVISYPWEPGYYLDSMSTMDDGTRFIHPWESVYCSPADAVKIPLHEKFHKGKFVAYDELEIDITSEKEIAENDPYYKTKIGSPVSCYRPSEFDNTMILYPRPSSIVWDDSNLLSDDTTDSLVASSPVDVFPNDPISIALTISDWGLGYHYGDVLTVVQTDPSSTITKGSGCTLFVYGIDASGHILVLNVLTNGLGYSDANNLAPSGGHGSGCKIDIIVTVKGGIVSYQEDAFDESDTGIIFDTVDAEDHFLMIFEAMPDEVAEEVDTWDDELTFWPPYMISLVEHSTLARCFGADTDGFIPSLRDYWELRKKIGIEAIKLFKLNKLTDRDFRMGGVSRPMRSAHPRLPSSYPRQYP
jgi:hypothetical protein